MNDEKISLDELCGGALREKVSMAMEEVAKNIMDPNTDWKKKRKLVVSLTFDPSEDREMVKTTVETKTTLAPVTGITTYTIIGKDLETGKVEFSEYNNQIKGQVTMKDVDPAFDRETGVIEEAAQEEKVVDFRKKA